MTHKLVSVLVYLHFLGIGVYIHMMNVVIAQRGPMILNSSLVRLGPGHECNPCCKGAQDDPKLFLGDSGPRAREPLNQCDPCRKVPMTLNSSMVTLGPGPGSP